MKILNRCEHNFILRNVLDTQNIYTEKVKYAIFLCSFVSLFKSEENFFIELEI